MRATTGPGALALTCGAALLLMGCGSGGASGGGGGGGGATNSLAPKASFAAEDVEHLLNRTGLGATPAAIDAVLAEGVPAYLDRALTLPTPGTSAWDQAAFEELVRPEDPPGFEGKFPSPDQLSRWWLRLMVESEHPTQESIALFWHDHFAVSSEVLSSSRRHWMVDHVNVLRAGGTGNFRDLLVEISRDPAMLRWLDGLSNTQVEPNENYAREFFELFSLGVDNGYEEHDIREAARVFTGYRDRFDAVSGLSSVEFDADRYDFGAKVVLGEVIPNGQGANGENYAAIVDLTLSARAVEVSEWVAQKALGWFVTPSPAPELVAELARVLRDADWELRPMFRTLFLSQAFYGADARDGMVKNPVDFAVGFIRQTGLQVPYRTLDARLVALGQRPTQPPGVEGWPMHELWLSAQGMVERTNLLRDCVYNEPHQSTLGVDVATLLPSPTATSAEIVDQIAARLSVRLTASERGDCIFYLDTYRNGQGETVLSTFDGANPAHVDERLRGLLYILAQHPTYMIR